MYYYIILQRLNRILATASCQTIFNLSSIYIFQHFYYSHRYIFKYCENWKYLA